MKKRSALWTDTTKDGAPFLRGTISLLGTKIRARLIVSRAKRSKVT